MGGADNRHGRGRTRNRDGGASLVEMAMIAPFIIFLLLGAIDASFLLFDNLDVRHAAREAGRLAAVNQDDSSAIVAAVCAAMDSDVDTEVTLAGAGGGLGDNIEATVIKEADTLTGFADFIFNPPVDLAFTSEFRLETAPAVWTDVSGTPCP